MKLASGDQIDLKSYEPAMRHLLDSYINARDSKPLIEFEEIGIREVIIKKGATGAYDLEKVMRGNKGAVAESIENNIRKVIIDEQPVNPKYYEKMSELLNALIEQRRQTRLATRIGNGFGAGSRRINGIGEKTGGIPVK